MDSRLGPWEGVADSSPASEWTLGGEYRYGLVVPSADSAGRARIGDLHMCPACTASKHRMRTAGTDNEHEGEGAQLDGYTVAGRAV